MHWLQFRARGDRKSDPRAIAREAQLRPGLMVQVIGAQGARVVRMETNGRRVSDVVNEAQDGSNAQPAVESLDLDDALILMPPPQTGDPRYRLHRPGRPVRIVVGGYEVVGNAHTPPGTQPVGFLLRVWPRFVALTRARLRLAADPEFSWRVPVAIVNLAKADLLRDAVLGDS